MLVGIFDETAGVQLLAFAGVALALWAAAQAALWGLRRAAGARLAETVPVAPFFVTVTTLFALFLGFMAADIWAQKRDALSAATDERTALAGLASLAAPAALDAPALAEGLAAYRAAAVEAEWGRLANRAPAPEVEAALERLTAEAVALAAGQAPPAAAARVFALLDGLAEARAERLALGSATDRIGNTAWFSVMVLALFGVMAIAVVHLDRPRAARLSTALFVAASGFAFWFLAMHDSPYSGGVRLEPSLLEAPSGAVVR